MSRLRLKRANVFSISNAAMIESLEQRQLLTAVAFIVNPAQSSLTVSGSIHTSSGDLTLTAQAPGSLSTTYSGTIDADVEANSIQFSNASAVTAQNNGTWEPDATPGDYGAFATSVPLAVRGLMASGSSAALTIAANGTFLNTGQSLAITAGELDYTIEGDSSRSLVGLTSKNGAATLSSYVVSNGQATLTLPISVTYITSTAATNDTTLTLNGTIVATAPAPVIATTISGNVHGSSGLANVTVYIDSNNNGVLNAGDLSTTTDSSGNYTLSGFNGGTYIVRQILPASFSQVTPTNGFGNHVTVASGKSATNINFTDATMAGSISGTVNGPGNTGLQNVSVYADLNNNGKFDGSEPSTATDGNGAYTLAGLATGAYIVRQILPAGYSQVTPSNGFGIHTTLASGHVVTNANFSDVLIGTPTGSISGEVYVDANGNGKLDSGETGLVGWTLYLDLNNSHTLVVADPTTATDVNGAFTFNGVAAGSYIVRTTQPSGWLQTTPTKNFGWHITLSTGHSVASVLFGEISDD